MTLVRRYQCLLSARHIFSNNKKRRRRRMVEYVPVHTHTHTIRVRTKKEYNNIALLPPRSYLLTYTQKPPLARWGGGRPSYPRKQVVATSRARTHGDRRALAAESRRHRRRARGHTAAVDRRDSFSPTTVPTGPQPLQSDSVSFSARASALYYCYLY